MTDKLPPNLLALFAPRPPLRWVPPPDYSAEDRRTANISGLAGFLGALKEYKDNDNFVPTESWLEARDRKKLEKKAAVEKLLTEAPKNCETIFTPTPSRRWATDVSMTDKPAEDPNIRGDAFKTLMVCRLSYQATEEDLEREFGRIGSIERVRTPLHTFKRLAFTRADESSRSASSGILTQTKNPTRRRSHTAAMHSSCMSARRT